MDYLRARLAEPSTHAALCALCASAAYVWPQYAAIIGALGAAFGVGGVVLTERAK